MRAFYTVLVVLLLALPGAAFGERLTAQAAREQLEDSQSFFLDLLTTQIDEYGHAGNYNGVIELAKTQIDIDPHWFESYSVAGWLLWSMKRFDEAEQLYKLGITNNPTNYRMYHELGSMYWLTARRSIYNSSPERSKELIKLTAQQLYQAVKYPCPPDVNRLLAHALHKLGRYDEERKVLEGVLKKHPQDFVAKRDLARLKKMGK